MAKSKDNSKLIQEARNLGIEPSGYNLDNDDQVTALQERVDGRKAEIKSLEGEDALKKQLSGETAPDTAGDEDAADDNVAKKSDSKSKK